MKRALITGIAGQDGSYLAEFLLKKNYQVYGLVRREPTSLQNLYKVARRVCFLYGDLRDECSLEVAVRKAQPDEIYNFAAQVFVPTSWEYYAETMDVNVSGLARLLSVVERIKPDCRVYQASSSEMYGNHESACSEDTPMRPESPYGISKLAAHHLVRAYRTRGLFVVSGIAFNHESPRRGPEMVTRKITMHVARWVLGDKEPLKLGRLEARRDWGFAGDYVQAMWLIMQQPEPRDYVIGTGESYSVEDFVKAACKVVGRPEYFERVVVDANLVRSNEIFDLRANPSRIRQALGWKPAMSFEQLVTLMLREDIAHQERKKRSAVAD